MMKRVLIAAAFLLTFPLSSMWLYSSPGTWVPATTSSHYTGTILGTNIQNDIDALGTANNGGVGDTNIVTDAEIKLSKMEHGLFYHMNGDSNSYKICYGDAKPIISAWTSDSLEPDASMVLYINFKDSSDIGNPGFAAAPTQIFLTKAQMFDTTWNGAATLDLRNQDQEARLEVLWQTVSSTACSVLVQNVSPVDTLWLAPLTVKWMALE